MIRKTSLQGQTRIECGTQLQNLAYWHRIVLMLSNRRFESAFGEFFDIITEVPNHCRLHPTRCAGMRC